MSCLPVFQNLEVDEHRLLKSNIRDLFRLFFASSALPKRLFSDSRLCHFSEVQAIAIRQDKMVTSFTLEDMLSLLVLWTRQPVGQRFLANASGTANLRMFYYYPVELVYWNLYNLVKFGHHPM